MNFVWVARLLVGMALQKWIVVAVVKRIDLSCVYLLLLLLVSLTKENDRERLCRLLVHKRACGLVCCDGTRE